MNDRPLRMIANRIHFSLIVKVFLRKMSEFMKNLQPDSLSGGMGYVYTAPQTGVLDTGTSGILQKVLEIKG